MLQVQPKINKQECFLTEWNKEQLLTAAKWLPVLNHCLCWRLIGTKLRGCEISSWHGYKWVYQRDDWTSIGKLDLWLYQLSESGKCFTLEFLSKFREILEGITILICGKLSQPWHYWHFGPGNSLLWGTPCTVGYLAASLTSAHPMPVAPLPHL